MKNMINGPWRAVDNGTYWDVVDANGFALSNTCPHSCQLKNGEHAKDTSTLAITNLIAAAPELYEALEAFARGVDLWLPADCHVKEEHCGEAEALAVLHRKMLGALDKARGEA